MSIFNEIPRRRYQEYIPAVTTKVTGDGGAATVSVVTPASHQLLTRFYHSIAGEYDTVKQTPAHSRKDVNASNIQVNEFKFKALAMTHPGQVRTGTFNTPIPTKNQTGFKLMYIGGHCHAPACTHVLHPFRLV